MRRTPLYKFHINNNAQMVDFAGWEMPVRYRSIIEEHHHTRNAVSLFDVSHMGRIILTGDDAQALLENICTRRLADLDENRSRYSHICNEGGGILDDVIVSRYSDRWMIVCNASNREKILAWVQQHAESRSVDISDTTESTLMVALQGPQAVDVLKRKLPLPAADLKRYQFLAGSMMSIKYTLSRSGYTGEDGFEMIVPAMLGSQIGSLLGGTGPIKPAGLGARDTLRLEAGMPLYGHELSEDIDPISAGQGWCVDLNKEFIGVHALRAVMKAGPRRRLVGLHVEGQRIARQHAPVLDGAKTVGEVTSGTKSPTLDRSIAMAYVDPEVTEPGRTLAVAIGSKQANAVTVPLPFYRTTRI